MDKTTNSDNAASSGYPAGNQISSVSPDILCTRQNKYRYNPIHRQDNEECQPCLGHTCIDKVVSMHINGKPLWPTRQGTGINLYKAKYNNFGNTKIKDCITLWSTVFRR